MALRYIALGCEFVQNCSIIYVIVRNIQSRRHKTKPVDPATYPMVIANPSMPRWAASSGYGKCPHLLCDRSLMLCMALIFLGLGISSSLTIWSNIDRSTSRRSFNATPCNASRSLCGAVQEDPKSMSLPSLKLSLRMSWLQMPWLLSLAMRLKIFGSDFSQTPVSAGANALIMALGLPAQIASSWYSTSALCSPRSTLRSRNIFSSLSCRNMKP